MAKILVIDNEIKIRDLCYQVFHKDGHAVVTMPRAEQLFEAASLANPDVILVGIQTLGEEEFFLLTQLLKNFEKRIPIVVFSDILTPEMKQRILKEGAAAVILKQAGSEELLQTVSETLKFSPRGLEPAGDSQNRKIMVVDDEENICSLLKKFLEKKGYQAILARNGEEALMLFEREKPSLVLLDIIMPGMDGTLVLKKMREIDPNIRIIMATGVRDEEMAREAIQSGASGYLVKPFDFKYLELMILTQLLEAP